MGQIVGHCIGRSQQSQPVLSQCPPKPQNEIAGESSSRFPLLNLPPELIVYNILPHVTYLDLRSLLQVNKTFKMLIDTNDQLWESAIKNEMLEKAPETILLINEDDQVDECLPTFETAKARFQYLLERRQKQPLTMSNRFFACGLTCGTTSTLYIKYITIRPSINVIRKDGLRHKLYVYFYHGEPQNNINADMLDASSRLFVSEPAGDPNTFCFNIPSQSACLKCQAQCYYPSRSLSEPQVYNWYVDYSRKKKSSDRTEVIEIYCNKCQRFSLWRSETWGLGHILDPPKF